MHMLQVLMMMASEVVDIGALQVSNVEAGQIKTDNLEVQQKAQFDQDVLVHGGLNVGHNALIGGSLSVTGSASSSLLSTFNFTTFNVRSGNVALGTSTAYAKLAVWGSGSASGKRIFEVVNSASTYTLLYK